MVGLHGRQEQRPVGGVGVAGVQKQQETHSHDEHLPPDRGKGCRVVRARRRPCRQRPASAATTACSPQSQAAIDDAFTNAYAVYKDVQLELNFYQPSPLNDGQAQEVYVNIKNIGGVDVPFTAENPLLVNLELTDNGVRSAGSLGTAAQPPCSPQTRTLTSVARTSWGEVTTFDATGTNTRAADWTFVGQIPGSGDTEADLVIPLNSGYFDQWCSGQRYYGYLTNQVCATVGSIGAPTLSTIITDDGQRVECAAYYQTALEAYNDLFVNNLFVRNFIPDPSNSTQETWGIGITACSGAYGNGVPTLPGTVGSYENGIF